MRTRTKLARIRDRIVCANKYLMGTWWPVMPKIVLMSGSIGVSNISLYLRVFTTRLRFEILANISGKSLRKPYQRTSWEVVLPCLYKQAGET